MLDLSLHLLLYENLMRSSGNQDQSPTGRYVASVLQQQGLQSQDSRTRSERADWFIHELSRNVQTSTDGGFRYRFTPEMANRFRESFVRNNQSVYESLKGSGFNLQVESYTMTQGPSMTAAGEAQKRFELNRLLAIERQKNFPHLAMLNLTNATGGALTPEMARVFLEGGMIMAHQIMTEPLRTGILLYDVPNAILRNNYVPYNPYLAAYLQGTITWLEASAHIGLDGLGTALTLAPFAKNLAQLRKMSAPAAASPYAHLRPGWTKHIDSVVDDLVASGRPKTVVLGEGGQGKIRSFVNREPSKMTEFLEMRPNSLDYTAQAKAGTLTPAMEAETLDFNLLMIERLQQRGFTFKVIGVDSSAAAKSSWLKAELEVLERLGTKWEVIPPTRVDEVLKLPKWR
ncbi:hypothetical protein [Tuwongella immobilis]|nr:hypothetical protein [Tuwongella immobilis]